LNGPNSANLAFEANGGSRMQTASLQLTDVTPVNIPPQSSNELRPGLDSPSVEVEETYSDFNSFLTHFTSENDIFTPEWPYVPDLATDFGEGYPLGSHADASSTSVELQSASNVITISEQLLQPSSSIPASLAYRDPSSLFERRKFSEPELELTGDLALHILHSYPYMVANQDSVPPFIHPKYQYLSENDRTSPSPLNAALKLAKMLLQGRRMNKSLIWGLIRIEQERLLIQVCTEPLNPCQQLVETSLLTRAIANSTPALASGRFWRRCNLSSFICS
jgi:hypothetical protein